MSRFPCSGCMPALLLALVVLPGCTAEEHGAQATEAAIERGPGKVRPLSEIMALARSIAPGKVIDVELESDVGLDDDGRALRWVYEVEVLTEDNQVVELEFDALTGKLLEIDGAPWPAHIPREEP